jgi:hypothetical protein
MKKKLANYRRLNKTFSKLGTVSKCEISSAFIHLYSEFSQFSLISGFSTLNKKG